MRSTTKAGLWTALVACHGVFGQRKSLAFGPNLPHTRFVTEIPASEAAPLPSLVELQGDPFPARLLQAKHHLENILLKDPLYGSLLVEGRDYYIREDSYTDESTGVSRVFVRQLVDGLEVADGDISLNMGRDGQLLSYGDSFHRGHAFDHIQSPGPAQDLYESFCSRLGEDEESGLFFSQSHQVPLDTETRPDKAWHQLNCNSYKTHRQARSKAASLNFVSDSVLRADEALLYFIIAAHPSPLVSQSILESFQEFARNITFTPDNALAPDLSLMLKNSLPLLFHNVPGALEAVRAKLVYVQSPSSSVSKLTLAWKFEIRMVDNWYEVYMDLYHPWVIHSVVDWASDAALAPIPANPTPKDSPKYRVWSWGINDPTEGERSLESGYDSMASPLGWHAIPIGYDPTTKDVADPSLIVNFTTTWGNNVFAHENWEGKDQWMHNYRPTSPELNFDFGYGPERSKELDIAPKEYINFTITQLFYTSNMAHDLFYRYGFDEQSGNFQQHNFGKGGKEGDGVIANAQDGSGYNNANFMTPPDGQNGRCRMYVWNTATPYRDGDLEAGIVVHELAHGLSTRLTGGPLNSACLGWGEAGGMGEGWGDFIATTIRSHKKYADFPMGSWAANRPNGIRNFPYSTNMTVNPSTYKTLDKPAFWGVHAIGEVWAEMLWVTEQKLIAKHGWGSTLFPPQPDADGIIPEDDFYLPRRGFNQPLIPKHGNTLMLKLVIDAMKLQPCRPSFFEARDAILQADQILTGGANRCEIWQGFSERGLGPSAIVIGKTPWGGGFRTDDFKLPKGVCS